MFARIVREAADPQWLSEDSFPCAEFRLLGGSGGSVGPGRLGRAEPAPPAAFVFWDCDCTRFWISLLAAFLKAIGVGEGIWRGEGERGQGRCRWNGAAVGLVLRLISVEGGRLQKGRSNSSGR